MGSNGRRTLYRRSGWAGVDEAGRGPLAGPVVAAAVIVPKGCRLPGVDDSKRLTPEEREQAARLVRERCVWAIGVADVEEIDRLNILRATFLAMERAIRGLPEPAQGVLVDGKLFCCSLPIAAETIVRGDSRYCEIAAASVIAKTYRDGLMRELDSQYPGYGFADHFGYATPEHIARLAELGPSPIHRKSFTPVRDLEQLCLILDE
jgi:ribonuclease HII